MVKESFKTTALELVMENAGGEHTRKNSERLSPCTVPIWYGTRKSLMFSTNAPLFITFGLSALDRIAYWRRIRLHGRETHSANGDQTMGTSFRDDVGGGKPEEHAGVPIKATSC
jgi:hypothetical protein